MTTATYDQIQEEERLAAERVRNLERARRVRTQQAEDRRKARPKRLATVEARMDELGREYHALPPGPAAATARQAIRRELRDLGAERMRLRYPE